MAIPPRRRIRRLLALSAAAAALLAAGACAGGGSTPSSGPTSVGGTDTLGSGLTPTATVAAPTAPAPTVVAVTYPASARAYAEAILTAWAGHQLARLGQLTSSEVQEQLIEIPGAINTHWHYNRCDGAAGSSYCVFFNDPGDMITLRLTNALLTHAHAGVGATFDQVSFPTDPVEYVKKFIGAWQEGNTYRMKILSNDTEVSYFTHYTPPAPGTSACYSDGAAGSQIRPGLQRRRPRVPSAAYQRSSRPRARHLWPTTTRPAPTASDASRRPPGFPSEAATSACFFA